MMRDPELEMEVDELCNLNTDRDPTEKELYDIYCWIDHLEFSRPKRNISRDFSDGVLMAELISKYLPKTVEPVSYSTSLSKKNKLNNWDHLNIKVFSKLGYKVDKLKMNDIMESKPGAIEKVLFDLRPLIARKNRSILNYRIGLKPHVPEVVQKPPSIPMRMTQAAQDKRKSQPHTTPNIPSCLKSRTRPTKPSTLKTDVKICIPENQEKVFRSLPTNIKLVTLEPISLGSAIPVPQNVGVKKVEPRKIGRSPHPRDRTKSPAFRSGSVKKVTSIRIVEQERVPEPVEVAKIMHPIEDEPLRDSPIEPSIQDEIPVELCVSHSQIEIPSDGLQIGFHINDPQEFSIVDPQIVIPTDDPQILIESPTNFPQTTQIAPPAEKENNSDTTWTPSPPTTAKTVELFGEQVFLSKENSTSFEKSQKYAKDGMTLRFVPGVHLGFYGLV